MYQINCQSITLLYIEQDPRLQGRAPGFRWGQDRDKKGWDKDEIGTRQGQVRQGKDKREGEG